MSGLDLLDCLVILHCPSQTAREAMWSGSFFLPGKIDGSSQQ